MVSDTAWDVTVNLNIRDHIRVYTRHKGKLVNSTRETLMPSSRPLVPWAIYLAWQGAYQYIVFDLDNHTSNHATRQVDVDRQDIEHLLDQQGIDYVTCQSSANGGYHIWIASIDNIDADLVRHLALLMSRIFTTLDPTPLVNPKTGCVRPPLSPHWKKGTSHIIKGELDTLYYPTTQQEDIENLLEKLSQLNMPSPVSENQGEKKQHKDTQGLPYIPGTIRPLSQYASVLIHTPITVKTDTSRRLYQIVCSAIKNHWHYNTLVTYIESSPQLPGFTHAYTINNHGTRVERPARGVNSMRLMLARMWNKAYTYITTHTKTGNDTDFLTRKKHVTTIIDALVTWNMQRSIHGTGQASDQRVINTLSLWALKANTLTLQADSRRIALACGLSRQAVSNSLTRLRKQKIITLITPASGRIAHEYAISPYLKKLEKRGQEDGLSAYLDTSKYAPKENTLTALYDALSTTLTSWLGITSHDACTHTGLGISTGNHLATQHLSHPNITQHLNEKAHKLGCAGITAQREATYTLERVLWAWWVSEVDYLSTKVEQRQHGRRPYKAHITRIEDIIHMQYPRQQTHEPDYKKARSLVLSLSS